MSKTSVISAKKLFYAVLILLSIPAIILLSVGIAEGGHKAYEAFFIRPDCTESTEATVLYYEGQLASQLIIGRTPYTVVEMSGENGKLREVELKGLYGHREGDILELHYNPEDIKQFYIGEIQYAPEPPAPPETTLDKVNSGLDVLSTILMGVVGIPLILLALAEIVDAPQPDKGRGEEGE